MGDFTHLHVHTEYSVLDGASNIKKLIGRAKEHGMKAIAITDHGNMFGVKEFHNEAKTLGIKPIIGCEIYVAKGNRTDRTDKNDRGYHLTLLAKNKTGYKNLIKIVSYSWIDGFYYNPRADKELLRKYKEGIIASSACLGGEIPKAIQENNIEKAKNIINEFKDIYGDDFYLELMRHKTGNLQMDKDVYERQELVNHELAKLSKELNVKLIATNDVHFVGHEDAEAHDRLICINTGKFVSEENRLHYTRQEYLKSIEEISELFSDFPEAISNTLEITDKIEEYELNHNAIMPDFSLPEGFDNEDDYLKHITYEGARKRYSDLTPKIKERIDFELETMKKMGYPGYFLIVHDFLNAARDMGVSVGPGRGSAAGSVVSYCLKITDIEPLKYNLLFERFLNPDRISMPDIDIDFDEDGRDLILKWVVEKYGKKHVAQIITMGRMLPRMAIRDVARVQELPLPEADRLAKLIPEKPGTSFEKAYSEVPELKQIRKSDNADVVAVLENAEKLEGTVRNTGIHACGIIIGRDDLEEHIPLCVQKDSDMYVTQFEGKHTEAVGMLKMDFLGLKTLSIIKDALENIKLSKNIDIDIDNIPLDDKKTFDLYSIGATTGLFQFESDGMKKHLKALKPNMFEDLIAMNALYRPGPMEYIPNYINRKHGTEKINYDLPEMEEILKETYGITVYQEQVMLLSQKLAGFTKGEADSLRKAMGKKKPEEMEKLQKQFTEGCKKNGHPENKAKKIWHDWEAFAQYAFNKSHSTCYAYISYQTAYLKAHHTAEFMAAVLGRNLNNIDKISLLIDGCRRMGIQVLGPDINESRMKFNVNKKGNLRFGLAAIKSVGEAAVENILLERDKNGPFKDIYDIVERINLHSVNKRTIDALVLAGCFDTISEIKRHQYFSTNSEEPSFVENLIRYGNKIQEEKNTSQQSLFGDSSAIEIKKPAAEQGEEWSILATLNKEKEMVGMYISAHPLDAYKIDIETICTHKLSELQDLKNLNDKEITIAGIVTGSVEKITKTGNPYGRVKIEDFSGSYNHTFFSKSWVQFKNYCTIGYSIILKGKVSLPEWKKENAEHELNIERISMLTDARKTIKNITIKIFINNINDELLGNLQKQIENNKGKTLLKFQIYDTEDNLNINMFSRTNSVYLSNEFIDYLKNNSDFEFKIN